MQTIKVFELLVKAFVGEEMPKRIKYDHHNYIYDESYDSYYQVMTGGNKLYFAFEDLNDAVEIIEDAPKDPIFTLRGTPNSIRRDLDLSILEEERFIQIPLEEYKQLLFIKGRYKELIKKETIFPNYKKVYVNCSPEQESEEE